MAKGKAKVAKKSAKGGRRTTTKNVSADNWFDARESAKRGIAAPGSGWSLDYSKGRCIESVGDGKYKVYLVERRSERGSSGGAGIWKKWGKSKPKKSKPKKKKGKGKKGKGK